jgi:FkbM family methyltransferase
MHEYSQLGQDRYVINFLNGKRNGYFVEIGVGNGEHNSNTCLLEREYGWTGILCEPNPQFIPQIKNNRTAKLETCPVWKISGEKMQFSICSELSGFSQSFNEKRDRKVKNKIDLYTISLNDVLQKHQSPTNIDYISLDTEGSEYDIISTFDFNQYNIKIWSIEHNTQHRHDGKDYLNSIIRVMETHGYKCLENRWDAYFYKLDKIDF